MELRYLKAFCVIAEEGHVTNAAKRLHIAQPALTQQIRTLESELHVKLLRRVGRGIQLTQAGQLLAKEGRELLEHARRVQEKVRGSQGTDSPAAVVIGITDVETMAQCVTTLLKEFRKRHPNVEVTQVLLEPSEVASALRDGDVDAAFSCGAVPDRHDLACYRVCSGSALVAMPVEHPLAGQASVGIEEIMNLPIVLLSHGEIPGSFEMRLRRVFTMRDASPHITQATTSVLLALNMVGTGTAIALVPEGVRGLRADAIAYAELTGVPDLVVDYSLFLRRRERSSTLLDLASGIELSGEPKDSLATYP